MSKKVFYNTGYIEAKSQWGDYDYSERCDVLSRINRELKKAENYSLAEYQAICEFYTGYLDYVSGY